MTPNTTCKQCGHKFHYCTNCGCDGAMEHGFCCLQCRCEWLDWENASLRGLKQWLEEENARLRESTRWRSVEEELPHPTNVVIAWCDHLTPSDSPFPAFYDLGKWWTNEGDPTGVDYWQPLPEPPQ